jgi:hypothetical protein
MAARSCAARQAACRQALQQLETQGACPASRKDTTLQPAVAARLLCRVIEQTRGGTGYVWRCANRSYTASPSNF